jgi:hypothetical protein
MSWQVQKKSSNMSNDVFDENKYNILSDCCMLDFIMRQLTIITYFLIIFGFLYYFL